MIYTEENYKNAKRDTLFEFNCQHCGKTFYRYKWQIAKNKLTIPKFCSTECVFESKKRKWVTVKCALCNKEFDIPEYSFNKSKTKLFFCCNSHSATYTNTNRVVTEETKDKISRTLRKKIGVSCDDERNSKKYYDICPTCGGKKIKTSKLCEKCKNAELRNNFLERRLIDIIGENSSYSTHLCTQIRKHARASLEENKNIEKVCAYCKNHEFDEILEVHHKKNILSFDKESKIKDINNENNLVWLCPNHHTMLERGLIKLN